MSSKKSRLNPVQNVTKWIPFSSIQRKIRLTLVIEFDDFTDYEEGNLTIEDAACAYGSISSTVLEMEA